MEPTIERTVGDWWWYSRSVHQILEHTDSATYEQCQYWFLSLQFDVFTDNRRDRQHSRLFSQLDNSLEVPFHGED